MSHKIKSTDLIEGITKMILYLSDNRGQQILDSTNVSIIRLDDSVYGNSRSVQGNYKGPFDAISSKRLEELDFRKKNKKFVELERIATELENSNIEIQTYDLVKGSYPLVMFQRDVKGEPIYDSNFSLFLLGKKFDNVSNDVFSVSYIGNLSVFTYNDAIKLAREYSEPIKNAFNVLNNSLIESIKARRTTSRNKKKQRKKGMNGNGSNSSNGGRH